RHGAQASTRPGSGEPSASAAKVASVPVTGPRWTARRCLQRPHLGCSPATTFSRGTRLVAPQAGHRIRIASAMAVPYTFLSAEVASRLEPDGIHLGSRPAREFDPEVAGAARSPTGRRPMPAGLRSPHT